MIRTEVYKSAKPLFLMGVGNGKVTHLTVDSAETLCGREGGWTELRGDICTACHKTAARMEAEYVTQGESNMAEKTEDTAVAEHVAANTAKVEQITANTERAKSLAEAENAEGLAELSKETEALVSSLPSRGKAPNDQTWAKYKQDARNAFRAAAQVQDKPEPKVKAKPAEVDVVDPKDYSIYQGVTELVADGAERVAEGVKLHLKTSDLAKEVASIMLDMWRRIPNKDDNPDIMGDSHAAKEAARALYSKAGEGFQEDYDTTDALAKLQRSVQTHRSDARAKYLRELDENADEQKRFAKALESKPEDVPVSQFLATLYDTQLKGHGELARERYQLKKELGADAPKAIEAETTPDERVQSFVKRVRTDFVKATPEDFEAASDETKQSVRDELMELRDAVNAMIKATL
jgi:tetratricopeptide (TPR) repeat protein